MSGDTPAIINMGDTNSQFARYVTLQTLNAISFPIYDINKSLRFWFKDFEEEIKSAGIENLDHCCLHLPRFMPQVIRTFIPSIKTPIKTSWPLLKEELLLHFGISLEDETQALMKQIRACKQRPGESIKLYSANWKHLVSLLPDGQLNDERKIAYFSQGIRNYGMRTSVITYTDVMGVTDFEEVIKKAIDLEKKARLDDNETIPRTETPPDSILEPMEIDFLGHKQKFHQNKAKHNARFPRNGKQQTPNQSWNSSNEEPPRLYDKFGKPVCGYCFKKHRNIDCQNRTHRGSSNNVHIAQETAAATQEETVENMVDLGDPTKPIDTIQLTDINIINNLNQNGHSSAPVSKMAFNDIQFTALWDTGSSLTIIDHKVARAFNSPIDTSKSVQYTDVNKNIAYTMGTIQFQLFNQIIEVQVIESLARQMIIGWNTMIKWKTKIDSEKQTIAITVKNKNITIKYFTNSSKSVLLAQRNTRQEQIHSLLQKYDQVVAKNPNKPTVTNLVQFSIDTGDHPPVYQAPRRYHPDIQKQIDEKLEELARNGIVDKVTLTEWGSPVTAVNKPDGSIRVCGNYIKLNAITNTIKYPFANIHYALQSLENAKIFSKIDLASGYYQTPIIPEHKEKTTLVTVNASYVFNVMPFGLKNAPAVFQSLMDKVLGHLRYNCAISYLDDVIIFSDNWTQHMKHLEQVLQQLQKANLSVNLKKCSFALTTIEFLGFMVSEKGVAANKEKIEPILQIPPPTNIKELERFLGITGVYQKFISRYQILTEPLRRLKKKDTVFQWGKEQQYAFKELKQQLCNLPYLKQPDFEKTFELHCDAATSAGIGVILCQRYDGQPYPLAFASKALNIHQQRYSVREIEAFAITWGIKKFRIYLERQEFLVFTDHSSLQWLLNTSQDKQPRLWRWVLFLQSYTFQVIYVKAKLNSAADIISRNPVHTIDTSSNSQANYWGLEQSKDPELSKLLNNKNQTDRNIKVINRTVYKLIPKQRAFTANKLFILVPSHLIPTILNKYHKSEFAGHGGYKKTKSMILNAGLWWLNMEEDIKKNTKNCQLCQKIKGNRSYQQHLTSTSADTPFARIAMDYFGPLPKSDNNHQYVLVIIDSFSRYVEIYPTNSTASMEFASKFYSHFILRHGIPEEIICDNGAPFGSEFAQELAKYVDTTIRFTPPNHPSSNGLVERFMKTLRTMILTYCQQATIVKNWDRKLRIIRFTYNNLWHSATRFAPFELVHGRIARTPLTTSKEENKPKLYRSNHTPQSQYAEQLAQDMELAFQTVWNHRNQYQEDLIDKTNYQEGDKVLIYNTQQSKANRPRKLLFDWKGPYVIQKKLSETRLELIEIGSDKAIKNVHVSLIKPFFEQPLQ